VDLGGLVSRKRHSGNNFLLHPGVVYAAPGAKVLLHPGVVLAPPGGRNAGVLSNTPRRGLE